MTTKLTNNFTRKNKPLSQQHVVHKVEKSKKRIGFEMRLTDEIWEYEMDQVILDLVSDVNVLRK